MRKTHNDRGVCPGEAAHGLARVPVLPTGVGVCEHRPAGAGVAGPLALFLLTGFLSAQGTGSDCQNPQLALKAPLK